MAARWLSLGGQNLPRRVVEIRTRELDRLFQWVQSVKSFQELDTSGDGLLDLEELLAAARCRRSHALLAEGAWVCSLHGCSETEAEELTCLFVSMDADGSGTVSCPCVLGNTLNNGVNACTLAACVCNTLNNGVSACTLAARVLGNTLNNGVNACTLLGDTLMSVRAGG